MNIFDLVLSVLLVLLFWKFPKIGFGAFKLVFEVPNKEPMFLLLSLFWVPNKVLLLPPLCKLPNKIPLLSEVIWLLLVLLVAFKLPKRPVCLLLSGFAPKRVLLFVLLFGKRLPEIGFCFVDY